LSLLTKRSSTGDIVKGGIIGFMIVGVLAVAAHLYTNYGYSKSARFNNLTFYYSDEVQENYVKTIQSKMSEYILIAEKVIGEKIAFDRIRINLKNNKMAQKDTVLSKGVYGYYSNNIIVLRSERYVIEGPRGDAVFYSPPDPVKTFYHEYTHYLTKDSGLPRWFSEGLAEYLAYKTLGQKDRKVLSTIKFNLIVDEKNWETQDKNLLYGASEAYINKIITQWGEESIQRIITESPGTTDFTMVLERAIGIPYLEIVNVLSK